MFYQHRESLGYTILYEDDFTMRRGCLHLAPELHSCKRNTQLALTLYRLSLPWKFGEGALARKKQEPPEARSLWFLFIPQEFFTKRIFFPVTSVYIHMQEMIVSLLKKVTHPQEDNPCRDAKSAGEANTKNHNWCFAEIHFLILPFIWILKMHVKKEQLR